MAQKIYDVIIVGAGPAGMAASLYTARDRYSTLMLDKYMPGGQINLTERIENYPGFERISGPDLVANMARQSQEFGAELKTSAEVADLSRRDDGLLEVSIKDKDKHVLTVGGGNVAVEDTIHLSKFASKVTMIHRRDEFRATPVLVEELLETAKKSGKIEILYSHTLSESKGSGKAEAATLFNKKTEESFDLSVDGVFVFVGMVPNTKFLEGIVQTNEAGYIRTTAGRLLTSMEGVFVAGDCREGAAMQLATACGDGVEAALLVRQYFRNPDFWTGPKEAQPQSWA